MIDDSRMYQIPIFNVKPRVSVAQWACDNRYMESTSAMFSYAQTPFFELPATYMSDIAGTGCVILKTPAQVGKTESILNLFGWVCEYDRANTMLVLDTQKSGEKMSKNRIRPFLRDTCGINNPNNTKKNPDKSNSVLNIGLGRGANLLICSAKSASDLRSTPVKYLLMDELDAWPTELQGEGDPVQLALQRQMRFRGMAVMTSTPTGVDGRIYQQYLIGTQQTWCVQCECGELLPCRWDDIIFTSDTPHTICPKCGVVLSEIDVKRLPHLYTQPKNENPYKDEYKRVWRSFEIFGTLCHEFYSWEGLKRQEMAAMSLGDSSYQSFRNTRLAEVYKPMGDIEIERGELMKSTQSQYTPSEYIPEDIAFIVLGIDTHDSCLYCETVGFSGDIKRQYGLDFRILPGDPDEKDCWNLLDERFSTVYTKESGQKIRPCFAFCDSGGHRSTAVYKYSIRNRRLIPVKGFATNDKRRPDPLVGEFKKMNIGGGLKGKINVLMLGVNAGKDALAAAELATISGNKRMFYPCEFGYNSEYYSGLLSEKKIDGKWVAPKKTLFNEPLDCRIYAMACAEYYLKKYYSTGKDDGGKVISNVNPKEPDPATQQETQETQSNPESVQQQPPKKEPVKNTKKIFKHI